MKIETDSETPRIGIHLDSEIMGPRTQRSLILLLLALLSVYSLCMQTSSTVHIIKRKPQSVIPGSTFQFKRLTGLEKNHSDSKFPRGTVVK